MILPLREYLRSQIIGHFLTMSHLRVNLTVSEDHFISIQIVRQDIYHTRKVMKIVRLHFLFFLKYVQEEVTHIL